MNKLTLLIVLLSSAFLSACATTGDSENTDPLESYNRVAHGFNDTLDTIILKPTAKAYDTVIPTGISHGVSNVFSNANEVKVVLNDLLQLKFSQAASDFGRFALNSTVGVAGIFDVASLADIEKHDEDFGQTLGHWGVGAGPYLVLPFFGPSSLRDGLGLFADSQIDIVPTIPHVPTRNQIIGTRIVDKRAQLLKAEKVLDAAALDQYSFMRDGYLQHRRNQVIDGQAADVGDDFDVFEE